MEGIAKACVSGEAIRGHHYNGKRGAQARFRCISHWFSAIWKQIRINRAFEQNPRGSE